MAKRFTDTAKWSDPWYRKLPCKYRDFWQYILDSCDNAGVWTKDFELASFCVGEALSEPEALALINNGKLRVKVLNGGSKWLIQDFVLFQFGKLNESSKVHKHILALQENHKNKGYLKGINTLKDKEQDKDKDKEKEKDILSPQKHFYLKYQEVFNKPYVANFGKDGAIFKDILKAIKPDDLIQAIDNFFASEDDFIKNGGYTVGMFKSQINKFVGGKKHSTLIFKKEA